MHIVSIRFPLAYADRAPSFSAPSGILWTIEGRRSA
jgi:hypothetical protein